MYRIYALGKDLKMVPINKDLIDDEKWADEEQSSALSSGMLVWKVYIKY